MTLNEWRTTNRYTFKGFAKLLQDEGIKASGRTVYNWEQGLTSPSVQKAAVVEKVTKGKVKPASFL